MELINAIDELERAIGSGLYSNYVYGCKPIPDEIDSYPESVVVAYLLTDPAQKELVSCLSEAAFWILLAYSERVAMLAVRENSPVYLERSLVALGLASLSEIDTRDVLVVMVLPWRAAKLLKLDALAAFENAAQHLPPAGRDFLISFAQRPPKSKSLECMGYIETTDQDGFLFKRTW